MSESLGLIFFGFAQVILFALPFLDRSPIVAPAHKRPMFCIWFFILLIDLIVLTIYGKLPPEGINNTIGFVAAITFIFLIVALPIITTIEKKCHSGGVE